MKKIEKLVSPVMNAIKGGIIYILSGSVLTKAITMISSIVIVRLVSKELYAYYSYATNLYAYIELLNGLELSGALLIVCSKNDNKELDKAYFAFCTKWSAAIQFLLSVILCVAVSLMSITYPEAKKYIYLYLLIPSMSAIINCIQSYNRAHLQNKRYSAMGVVRAAVITCIAVLLVPLIQIEGLILARYMACIVVIIIGGSYCYKNMHRVGNGALSVKQKRDLLNLSLSMLVASFFSYIMPVNETFLVNKLIHDPTTTANFKVAGLLPQQLSLISGGICVYFYPTIAKAKDYISAKKKIVSIGIYTFAAVILVAFVGILLTPVIIKLLYGNQYLDAIGISRLLWIMRTTHCAYRAVPITLLPALGDTKFNFIASPVICVIHFLIDYWLISGYGMMGVAYATMAVNIISGTCAWIYLIRYCNRKYAKS